jgi:hypothetical protein
MDTTTAIIQFIGIVLFSAQVPNDPGIHAILPRIGHVHTLPAHLATVPDDAVENHVAVILYRKEDRLHNVGGWRADGFLKNGWEYVLLDGERVQFLTDGENGKPEIPSLLPRPDGGRSCLSGASAPHLRPAYTAPYEAAAGVIDMPSGRLDACESSSSRIDTRLAIKTGGVLVIAAKKRGERAKTISLDEDAVVYVANVPPKFLLDDYDAPRYDGLPHWDAYNAMLDPSCGHLRPEPVKPDLQGCDGTALTDAYKTARKNPPSKTMPNMVDSECSNSQWP